MCRILLAWHFDHVHARRPRPADRAAAPDPTAAPATAATTGPGPGRDTHGTPRRRNSGGGRRPCSVRTATKRARVRPLLPPRPPRPVAGPPGRFRAGQRKDRGTGGGPGERRLMPIRLAPPGRRRVRKATVRLPLLDSRRAPGKPGRRRAPGKLGCRRAPAGCRWTVRPPRTAPGRTDGQRWPARSPRAARRPRRRAGGGTPRRGTAVRPWRLHRSRGAQVLLHARLVRGAW